MSKRTSLLLLPLFVGSGLAFAGPDKDKCTNSSKQHKNSCQSAVDGVKASEASRSATTSAAANATGPNMNKNSGNLGNDIAAQRADIAKAKQQCEQDKKQCEQDCDQAKQSAQQKLDAKKAQKPPPSLEPEQSDVAQIPGEKEKECSSPIAGMLGQLGQAESNLAKDADAAKNTKDSTPGGMPQMPQPPQKDDDKTADSGTSAQAGNGLQCTAAGSERFSDCNETYTKKCAVDMTAAGCNSFADRYCNLGDSSGTVASPMMQPALGTNLVVDKKGEGVGQSFCTTVNAYRFCQVKGREACPSCLKLNGADTSSSDTLARAAGECPTDPSFIAGGTSPGTIVTGGNPTTGTNGGGQDHIVGGVGGSGGGAGGGGSGSTAGGGTGGGQPSGTILPESVRRLAAALGLGGGSGGTDGGGGGGSTPWTPPNEDETKKEEAPVAEAAAGIPPLYQPARDVASKASSGLFVLGSRAYTAFCTRSQLKSCK